MKVIGQEWKKKDENGCFTADHMSPSQLNMNLDQWLYNYCVLTAAERKKLPANLKMIFGGLAGQAMQDMIQYDLTLEEVMQGKKK